MKRITYPLIKWISRTFLVLCLGLGGFFLVYACCLEAYDRTHPDDYQVKDRIKARQAVIDQLDELSRQYENGPTKPASPTTSLDFHVTN